MVRGDGCEPLAEGLAMALREVARLPALVACAALLLAQPAPSAAQDASWPPAVDRLAREKALAEGCVAILKTFGDHAPMARVQGQRLYARAKADMDGLIGLLLVDLAKQRPLADAPELRHRLDAVVAQRRTLCRQVDAAVGTALRQRSGRTSAADLLAEGSGDALSSLIKAAVQIWQAYGDADQGGRAAIIGRIGAMRWLDYAEVPAA
jgi:hypothetical protein